MINTIAQGDLFTGYAPAQSRRWPHTVIVLRPIDDTAWLAAVGAKSLTEAHDRAQEIAARDGVRAEVWHGDRLQMVYA